MEIKTAVAKRYSQVAAHPEERFNFPVGRVFAESVGYPKFLLDQWPASLWESFTGAGNPYPFVDIKYGEVILDLGCGAGLDAYLYAQAAGPSGQVYGLDLSMEMINKAEANMKGMNARNVKLFWTSADRIPLADQSIDLVTSNGIYNLSPDKGAVMREAARVLKPGGRTIFAEIILKEELPENTRHDLDDWFRCVGGAMTENKFLNQMKEAGFNNPRILWKGRNARTGHPSALSAVIRAEK